MAGALRRGSGCPFQAPLLWGWFSGAPVGLGARISAWSFAFSLGVTEAAFPPVGPYGSVCPERSLLGTQAASWLPQLAGPSCPGIALSRWGRLAVQPFPFAGVFLKGVSPIVGSPSQQQDLHGSPWRCPPFGRFAGAWGRENRGSPPRRPRPLFRALPVGLEGRWQDRERPCLACPWREVGRARARWPFCRCRWQPF